MSPEHGQTLFGSMLQGKVDDMVRLGIKYGFCRLVLSTAKPNIHDGFWIDNGFDTDWH